MSLFPLTQYDAKSLILMFLNASEGYSGHFPVYQLNKFMGKLYA